MTELRSAWIWTRAWTRTWAEEHGRSGRRQLTRRPGRWEQDEGSIVETVVIIGLFVAAAIIIVGILVAKATQAAQNVQTQ